MNGKSRGLSATALALLVPAPSIGAFAAMVLFPRTILGQGLFIASKCWLFAFPALWMKIVDRERFGFSPVRNGGFVTALVSGCGLALIIVAGWLTLGPSLLDRSFFVTKMREIGLASPAAFFGCAAYWIMVNSVLEEYVWRWFVYAKCEALVGARLAVPLAAFFFTLHHVVALRVYCGPLATLICSLGVFVAGAVWSLIYARYRSIWPAYVSHAIADAGVFAVGAAMLYGGG